MEFALRCNHLQVNNSHTRSCKLARDELQAEFEEHWRRHQKRPLVGRDEILASFCPQVGYSFPLGAILRRTHDDLSLIRCTACTR